MIYYFGVWPGHSAGHYLHGVNGSLYKKETPESLQDIHLKDGDFAPFQETKRKGSSFPGKQDQGFASFQTYKEWHVISFWDRTEDKRFGSSSTFFIDASFIAGLGKQGIQDITFDLCLEACKKAYPKVFERLAKAKIILVQV